MREIFFSVFKLLDADSKKQAFYALSSTVLFGIIELIGIGSLFLFMQVVVLDSPDELPDYLKQVYNQLELTNYSTFIFLIGALTVFSILLRSGTFLLQRYLQSNFVGSLQVKLSTALFSKYMAQSIEFFLIHTTSRLTKNLLQEIPRLCGNTVYSLVDMISNFIALFMIVVFLLVKEPVLVAYGFIGMLLFYTTVYKLLRGYISKKGVERVLLSEQFFTSVQQSLLGIREIKLYNAFDKSLKNILDSAQKQKVIFVFFGLYQQVPRQLMEIVVAAAIVGYILFQHDTDAAKSIIPQLTLLAAGIYRLLPKFDAIMASFMKIKFDISIINVLQEHLAMPSHGEQHKNQVPFQKSIEIKNVTYHYPNTEDKQALQSISLSLNKGDIIGIQGVSGSGKTTLLEIICNLLPVKEGSIYVDGKLLDFENDVLNISYISQEPRFFAGSIAENIAFGVPVSDIDDQKVEAAAKAAKINGMIEALPEKYNHPLQENAENLSGGQKQRIALARALYKDSDLIILDEATNALDKETEKEFMQNILELKGTKTVLIVSHNPDCFAYCDKLVRIENGKLTEVK